MNKKTKYKEIEHDIGNYCSVETINDIIEKHKADPKQCYIKANMDDYYDRNPFKQPGLDDVVLVMKVLIEDEKH